MENRLIGIVIFAVCNLLNSLQTAASETDGMFWYDLYGDEATVTGTRSMLGDRASIPYQVTFNSLRYDVVAIADGAFSGWQLLTACEIPEGIRKIGKSILYNTKVSSIIVPSTVQITGSKSGAAFNNSTMRTIIYLSPDPPMYWNAVSNTYVIDPDKYTEPWTKTSNAKIKGIVEFSSHEFEYTGKSPSLSITNNLQADGWNAEYTLPELEKDAGSYEIIIPIKFQHKQTYERFTANVPFRYIIKKRNLTVSINNQDREYGGNNPQFTFLITGFINNDNTTDIQELPTIICAATKTSDVGEYPIIGIGGQSINYNFIYSNGVLTIKKAPMAIQVGNETREYGTSNPQFKLNFVGLKNGEQFPKWDKSPTFSTDATKESNVGTYQITVDCKPHNYEIISIENGTLSISKAPLLLTADDIERSYYSENPEFTYTLSGLRNNDNETCLTKLPSFSCTASIRSDCGKYNITPANAEAENYDICYNDGKLTIFPASLILYPQNITREYGDPNPLLKYEAIGLKGDDNLVSALTNEPNLSTTATENSNVGEYAIIIGGATSKNYVVGYRQGIITVAKAPLTVVAENAERQYGEANPIFSRSYSGFKLDDTESSAFSVLPRLTCSATKTSGVGEYPIAVSGGTSRNYEIVSYENGVLNVTKAPLTLVATDKSRLYFEDNPSFDFTLIGLRNSDTKSCMSTQPSFKCTAVKTSNVGEYDIEPFNATAQNYTIDYQKGILSINKRALTASVGNCTKIYGSENPQFEIDYIGFVNSEDQSVLSNIPNIVCAASRSSDVGLYPISLEGGDALNYDINKYNSGSLTIEKADQVISWNQDLSNIQMYSQVALEASSSAGLPVSYEMSPNNVATLYNNNGTWYLDCFGSGAVNIRAVQNGDKNHNAASMVSNTLVVMGTGGDPSTPQIFLNIENAGTLPDLIADNRKYQIKNLRLTGYLNGTDIKFIREMAGSDDHGSNTPGVLETLDISGCTIVSGGRSYYKYYQTSDNKIGDYMFYNCKQLVNLLLPENTTVIEDYAFADCDRLSVISIPEGVEEFGIQAFCNDISLLRIPMPSSLISIKDYAFMGCNGVSEITIPSRVTNIGDEIVKDCQNISKINVADGNSHFASEDGVLYTSSFDELLIFPVNYESNSYIVKDGTKTIAPYAFVNSKRLNEVTLPSTLTNIGEDAFIGCVNLSSLQVKALNPPVCYNDCFDAVSKTRCELTVPNGCYSYYWVAPVWADFNKIKESDFSDIDDVLYNGIKVYVENRNIIIDGVPDGIQVRIFQVDGTLIYQVQSTGDVVYYSPVQSGIYIAVIANKAYKLKVH